MPTNTDPGSPGTDGISFYLGGKRLSHSSNLPKLQEEGNCVVAITVDVPEVTMQLPASRGRPHSPWNFSSCKGTAHKTRFEAAICPSNSERDNHPYKLKLNRKHGMR
jgi:hypothetical protein